MIDGSDSVSWQMLLDQIVTMCVESMWLFTDREKTKKRCDHESEEGEKNNRQTDRQTETKQPVWKHMVWLNQLQVTFYI